MLLAILECIGDWHMRTLIDEVINHKDITQSWLTIVCVWLLECLSMYVNNYCSAMFYVSLNVLLRALSFGTTIMPQQSDYSILFRVLSNDYK